MQRLPATIEAAIREFLEHSKGQASRLSASHRGLGSAYREGRSHRSAVQSESAARLAYLAARMPATYAAIAACLAEAAQRAPGSPCRSLLDIGAGPGTASLAAAATFPELGRVTQVDADPAWQEIANRLGEATDHPSLANPEWRTGPLASLSLPVHDWVVAAYVLDEISIGALPEALEKLWDATGQVLLLVCAGTPYGFARLLAAREQLLKTGASILAPCTHASQCPMREPDWCHRPVRLARTRAQQEIKHGHLNYEDEKFCYLALSRSPGTGLPQARIVMRPRAAKGHVRLTLCASSGLTETVVSARAGSLYRSARDAQWGDAWGMPPTDERSR